MSGLTVATLRLARPLWAISINLQAGTVSTRILTRPKRSLIAAAAMALIASFAMATALKESYLEYDGGPEFRGADDGPSGQRSCAGTAGATLGG